MNLFAGTLESIEKSQLPFVQALKAFRNPFFDLLNYFFSFFDTVYFVLLLIPIIWVFISRSWGIRLAYLLSFSSLVNESIKYIFQIPRPFIHDLSLGMLDLHSYSFPSGAAQKAVILACLIIWARPKSIWAWILGINYFIWTSFARIYLGVHYPLDLLAGWCVGAVILLIFFYLFPKIVQLAKNRLLLFGLAQVALILLFKVFFSDFYNTKKTLMFLSLSSGICLGLHYCDKISYFTKTTSQKFIKLSVCLLGILISYFVFALPVFSLVSNTLPNLFMSLWLTLFHEKILKIFS